MNERKKIRDLEREVRRIRGGIFQKDLKGRELDRHGERGSIRLVSPARGKYTLEARYEDGWVRFPQGVVESQQPVPPSGVFSGMIEGTIEVLTGDGIIVSRNGTVLCTTGANPMSVTLPEPSDGAELLIKKIDNGVGKVVITGGTIDGEPYYELNVQWNFVRLQAHNLQWYVVANN